MIRFQTPVFAALSVLSGAVAAPIGPTASVVPAPPTDRTNSYYIGNRPPLEPSPLIKLPIGAIDPQGVLRVQLELMRDGMTGHLPEVSHWVRREGNAWVTKNGEGESGWEEAPYWLKGFGDLGYVLKDDRIIGEAKAWMEEVMAAQREDGYFGSEDNRRGGPENMQLGAAAKPQGPDLWPHMPMIDALKSYHEATNDPAVIGFLTRYFQWQASLPKEQLFPGSWQKLRAGDNLESVLWLYNRTGDARLLDLARTIHERTAPWKDRVANWHGVNICQGFREPAVFWLVSRDRKDLDAAERNYQEVMGLFGQVPGGMFGADENTRRGFGDPRQAAETCSMVEFMSSFQQLLRFTGDPLFADRCEEVVFNSLPAAFSPDGRALHYLTSPNMVQLDSKSKAPGLANDGTMISYEPGEVYRCCQHNHAMGWPYYAEHLWMATPDNGLAAVLYSACRVTAKVGSGTEVTLRESTDYPFGEEIRVTVETPQPVTFPIYFRVPGWCDAATAQVGSEAPVAGLPGKYLRLEREWQNGESIQIRLPMSVAVKRWQANKNSASVRRGPLWFSLKIGERYEKYRGTEPWPSYEVYPTSPWNYGLVLDEADPSASFQIETVQPAGKQLFQTGNEPIRLVARGKRIPAWQQDRRGLVGVLHASPVASSEPEERITLIPMGAARLRISQFPVIGSGPGARDWPAAPPVRHDASHESDDINAVSDGVLPARSSDHEVSRFTWWDHRGSTEWITWKFETPRRVDRSSVYWFDDTGIGRCRVPASWKLYFRDGDRWVDVGAAECGTLPDRFNEAAFKPVTSSELKLEVHLQPGFSGGILEWRVEDAK